MGSVVGDYISGSSLQLILHRPTHLAHLLFLQLLNLFLEGHLVLLALFDRSVVLVLLDYAPARFAIYLFVLAAGA